MKIGIITFHRAHNYGAVLQCYALSRVLQSMGCEVEVIDYRNQHIEDYYSGNFSWNYLFRCILKLKRYPLIQHLRFNLFIEQRRRRFRSFRNRYLSMSRLCLSTEIPQDYDCYIIGSDQMWGIHCYGGYDPIYWGEFKRPFGSRLYGYAISASGDYRKHLSNEQIRQAVDRFDDITFREKFVAEDVCAITGLCKNLALDPILLADISIWTPLLRNKWQKRTYVAVYHIRKPAFAKELLQIQAEEFARSHGWEVIDLSEMNYSVEDFVSVIRYAQCVFTTSFHATVFSIIFRIPFWSYRLNDGHDGRYVDLLQMLGLSSHIVDSITTFADVPIVEDCSLKIESLKEPSVEYIKKIIM